MQPDQALFDYVVPHGLAIDSPYLSDYFGIWAVHEQTFQAVVDRLQGLNLHAHLQSAEKAQSVAERDKRSYAMTEDGVALIQIRGPMMKAVPSMDEGTSTVRVRQQLREARRDPSVKGALLVLDTPGGTVKGNRDLADDVAAFAAEKIIYAFTEDLTASAGVSVASQATKRYANQPTALYGSMGTYAVLLDLSGRAEQLGVKVHVVRAGAFKGMGEPGTPVSAEQLAEVQRNVNAMNEGYLEVIARGLGKSVEQIRPLADGRVHTAQDAVGLGLIDGVQSFDATYRQLVSEIAKPRQKSFVSNSQAKSPDAQSRSKTMEKTPATLAQLKSTFPKSSADWRESQIEAGADLSEAAIAYATFVEQRATDEKAALQKQLDEAKAAGKAKSSVSLGHQPLKQTGRKAPATDDAEAFEAESGDPIEDFNALVSKKAGDSPSLERRHAAIRSVASSNPELYRNFLLASNPGKRQMRLISEKLEASN